MIWKDVSLRLVQINEEYLAIEIIMAEKNIAEEVGCNPWDTTGPLSLTDGLWAEFVGRCFEALNNGPRLSRDFFNRLTDTIMPDPRVLFHMPTITLIQETTASFANSKNYQAPYEEYVNYFTGKGVWKKALMKEEDYNRIYLHDTRES